jgi:alpha-glucosidase (family GH31 glycosyl hydrolase)
MWKEVYDNYTLYDLPLDVMWADIDYLDDYKIFTIANDSYVNFSSIVDQVKEDGRRFVPIIDPGVAVRDANYRAYKNGLEQDVFILQSNQKDPLTGGVWPGNVHYPDFFKTSTTPWWWDNFDHLYNDSTVTAADGSAGLGLKFDGVWLDMNEASNFCDGYCDPS